MALRTTFDNENTLLKHAKAGTLDKFHSGYDEALAAVRRRIASRKDPHPLRIGGRDVRTSMTFTVVNPGDHAETVGRFASGSRQDVDAAVAAAKAAFPAWSATPYEKRCDVFEAAARLMQRDKLLFSTAMTIEAGKNRAEAVTDVDEAIDFLRYYPAQMRRQHGYQTDLGEPYPGEHCTSVLRPYGVFGVVAPFNFPVAILVGMTAGALVTGNTAVVKPASTTPHVAHLFFDILGEAGLPAGVANLVTGSGSVVGQGIVEHPDVAGIVFTGSREVGIAAAKHFIERKMPGPVIAELGGKNAVVVSDKADLDKAVEGTWKAAFGFGGQKCSATSRVYVHAAVKDEFTRRLVEAARKVKVGPAEDRDTYLGPLIDAAAVARYQKAVAQARKDGTVLAGGGLPQAGKKGHYVEPTVIDGLPKDHGLALTELFLPIVCVFGVASFDEALQEVDRADYGLTGGVFSEDPGELARYFESARVGVAYSNRRRSASTGALVHGQPFGGWKWSGTTGKNAGGAYYLPQFMHEQTRTVVREAGQ